MLARGNVADYTEVLGQVVNELEDSIDLPVGGELNKEEILTLFLKNSVDLHLLYGGLWYVKKITKEVSEPLYEDGWVWWRAFKLIR